MTTIPSSIMARLRDETTEAHKRAESQPIEGGLARGTLPLEKYVDYLKQRYVMRVAHDAALRRAMAKHPAFAKVIHEYMFLADKAAEDLRHFGQKPEDVRASASTAAMIRMIEETERSNPVALLGIHYVLEGSNNGARFISRAIRKAYQLNETDGTRYLDPYGEAQRGYWAGFKESMDSIGFTNEEMDAMVEAAVKTFDGIMETDKELLPA